MSNIVDQNMAMNAMTDQEMVQRKMQIDALRKHFGDSQTKEQKLRQACEGFESIFIQKMWEQMRSSVPKGGYLHSREEEMYQSMFDQEFSKKMASAGGIGLGDMLYEQLSVKLGDAGRAATPSATYEGMTMDPVRMSHMQPREQVDYAAKLLEAENAVKAVAEASMPRTLNTDLYSPLDETLEAAAEPEISAEESLVQAALSDFAGTAVVNNAQAELAQASLAGAQAVAASDAAPAQQPKQPFALGRVTSPRHSAEGARDSISPHSRIDVGNTANAEAKEEARILNRAKSVASKTQKTAKNAQAKDHANYVSSPLPAAVPQGVAGMQPGAVENAVSPAASYPEQNNYLGQTYPGQVPAAYGQVQGVSAAMNANAMQNIENLSSGIQPAVGATILPPEVRASQQQAAAQAAEQNQLPGSQSSGRVIGSFDLPVSAMSQEQAQIAKVDVPAGSRPIVEAPSRAAGIGEQPVRKQSLIEDGPVPAAYGRTGAMSQGSAPATPLGRQTSQVKQQVMQQAPQWPLNGEVSSAFGWQKDGSGQKTWNPGVEIASAEDASVKAFMDGAVAFAGEHEDYGNLVVLEHAAGLKSYYGNAKAQGLQPGDQVKVGTEIAKISMATPNGQAGNPADPAYLRFETRRGELPLNPESFIAGLF